MSGPVFATSSVDRRPGSAPIADYTLPRLVILKQGALSFDARFTKKGGRLHLVAALVLVLPIFAPLPDGDLNTPGSSTVLIEDDEVEVGAGPPDRIMLFVYNHGPDLVQIEERLGRGVPRAVSLARVTDSCALN